MAIYRHGAPGGGKLDILHIWRMHLANCASLSAKVNLVIVEIYIVIGKASIHSFL